MGKHSPEVPPPTFVVLWTAYLMPRSRVHLSRAVFAPQRGNTTWRATYAYRRVDAADGVHLVPAVANSQAVIAAVPGGHRETATVRHDILFGKGAPGKHAAPMARLGFYTRPDAALAALEREWSRRYERLYQAAAQAKAQLQCVLDARAAYASDDRPAHMRADLARGSEELKAKQDRRHETVRKARKARQRRA